MISPLPRQNNLTKQIEHIANASSSSLDMRATVYLIDSVIKLIAIGGHEGYFFDGKQDFFLLRIIIIIVSLPLSLFPVENSRGSKKVSSSHSMTRSHEDNFKICIKHVQFHRDSHLSP
jgi:hypothetical protein